MSNADCSKAKEGILVFLPHKLNCQCFCSYYMIAKKEFLELLHFHIFCSCKTAGTKRKKIACKRKGIIKKKTVKNNNNNKNNNNKKQEDRKKKEVHMYLSYSTPTISSDAISIKLKGKKFKICFPAYDVFMRNLYCNLYSQTDCM